MVFKLARKPITAWKVSKYWVISGLHFPALWLNMEIYSINPHIQSEYRKIWTRKYSTFRHFSHSDYLNKLIIFVWLFVSFFTGYNQSLRWKSSFTLFWIFNYVTYINSHPLNPFIGKFRSSQRRPGYQYYLMFN